MPNAFNPLDFLALARQLAADAQEVNLRVAVSRAYYAIFLLARDKANIRGKDAVHQRTKTAIQSRSFAAGGEFETLRQMRVHADYLLKPGDLEYDTAYDDWERNWKDADALTQSLLLFLRQWQT